MISSYPTRASVNLLSFVYSLRRPISLLDDWLMLFKVTLSTYTAIESCRLKLSRIKATKCHAQFFQILWSGLTNSEMHGIR